MSNLHISTEASRAVAVLKASSVCQGLLSLRVAAGPPSSLELENCFQSPAILIRFVDSNGRAQEPLPRTERSLGMFCVLPLDLLVLFLAAISLADLRVCARLSRGFRRLVLHESVWKERMRLERMDPLAFFTDPKLATPLQEVDSFCAAYLAYRRLCRHTNGVFFTGSYAELPRLLHTDQCRHVLVKIPTILKGAQGASVRKVFLVSLVWAGVNAPIRQKMLLASCSAAVRRVFSDVDMLLSATDHDDLSLDIALDFIRSRARCPAAQLDMESMPVTGSALL